MFNHVFKVLQFFVIFGVDRHIDRQTERPTDLGTKAPSRSLTNNTIGYFDQTWKLWRILVLIQLRICLSEPVLSARCCSFYNNLMSQNHPVQHHTGLELVP